MRHPVILAVLLLIPAHAPRSAAMAPWPVCTAPGHQTGPRHASGHVFWVDSRDASNPEVYRAPDRGGFEEPFVAAPGHQSDVRVAEGPARCLTVNPPDVVARAMVTWVDSRSGSLDIRARLDGSILGSPPPDVVVCDAPDFQTGPRVVHAGGTFESPWWIVAWLDRRSGSHQHVYAQRIGPNGAGAWAANGVALSTVPGFAMDLDLAADGAGGALLAWGDPRGGVYVHRVTADGAPAPGWPVNGVSVGVLDEGARPRVVSDGAGGALVCWTAPNFEGEPGASDFDVFAQHLDAQGQVAAGWPAAGLPLCAAPHSQELTGAVTDGAGGVIAVWVDGRNVQDEELSPNFDIRAVRVSGGGTIAPGWAAGGTVVCDRPFEQSNAVALADGEGGVYIAWEDREGSLMESDIRASHLDASGQLPDAGGQFPWRWPANGADGVMICGAAGAQTMPALGIECGGQLLVTWEDARDAGTGGRDIYAVTMSPYGNVDVERPLLTPARLALGGPFPNPGRGAVQARLELPVASTVDAWIADVTGRRVTTLVSGGIWSQGVHELRWDGRDGSGAMVRAGVYTLHVRAGDGTAVRSIVRLR